MLLTNAQTSLGYYIERNLWKTQNIIMHYLGAVFGVAGDLLDHADVDVLGVAEPRGLHIIAPAEVAEAEEGHGHQHQASHHCHQAPASVKMYFKANLILN